MVTKRMGLDTNVLITAHLPSVPGHVLVRAFLLDVLADSSHAFFITPNILHEFVHVITDTKRFDPPVPMFEALALARHYLGRSNIHCVAPDDTVLLHAFELLERYRLGRKRIADTLFAATLMHHDVTELVTLNAKDYQVFGNLRVIVPA